MWNFFVENPIFSGILVAMIGGGLAKYFKGHFVSKHTVRKSDGFKENGDERFKTVTETATTEKGYKWMIGALLAGFLASQWVFWSQGAYNDFYDLMTFLGAKNDSDKEFVVGTRFFLGIGSVVAGWAIKYILGAANSILSTLLGSAKGWVALAAIVILGVAATSFGTMTKAEQDSLVTLTIILIVVAVAYFKYFGKKDGGKGEKH